MEESKDLTDDLVILDMLQKTGVGLSLKVKDVRKTEFSVSKYYCYLYFDKDREDFAVCNSAKKIGNSENVL